MKIIGIHILSIPLNNWKIPKNEIDFLKRNRLIGISIHQVIGLCRELSLMIKADKKYDDQGRLIWYKIPEYQECFVEYNYQGDTIITTINGDITIYNKDGLEIYNSDSNSESRFEYDEQGNELSYTDSTGYSYINEYNDQGRFIYSKDSMGNTTKVKYKGNRIITKYKGEEDIVNIDTIDSHGNIIREQTSIGTDRRYNILYYPDGQLKSWNDIEIPYFEKE